MSELESGFLRLASGLRLRYRRLGEDGPTVLLLHGWPQTGHAWRRILPTLAASGYVAVAPDLRGAGDSDKPAEGYDAVSRMEDVRELVSALGLGDSPIFAVGLGEGAEVARAYTLTHPGEVAGLATVSEAGSDGPEDWHTAFHATPDLPELLLAPHLEAYLRHFFRAWAHDPDFLAPADLALYVRALSTPGALRAGLAPFRAARLPPQPVPDVPRLRLVGESDPRRTPTGTDGAATVIIPRGGHWLPEERPDPVAAALLTFFPGTTAMYLDIAEKLRECRQKGTAFTRDALAQFFGVGIGSFSQDGPAITYHQSGSHAPVSYVLKGTVFFADTRRLVRGYPRILPASDYTTDRFAATQERRLFRALRDGEVIVEKKEDGVNIRLYQRDDKQGYGFATRDVYDGGNPLVSAGIENVRGLGIDYGTQARRLIDKLYPLAYKLADLGYVPCFEMLLPEIETVIPADRPDMILIDVIDPDFMFVDRLEKERIAEDYRLRLVELQGRLVGGGEAGDVYKRLRSLEHLAARDGWEGFVVKGRFESSDQIFLKVKPASVRDAHRIFSLADLKAVWEAVAEDFTPADLADPDFAEEAMLDYLGSHGRNARWQVQDFLAEAQKPE